MENSVKYNKYPKDIFLQKTMVSLSRAEKL